jgi:hypothetical protein
MTAIVIQKAVNPEEDPQLVDVLAHSALEESGHQLTTTLGLYQLFVLMNPMPREQFGVALMFSALTHQLESVPHVGWLCEEKLCHWPRLLHHVHQRNEFCLSSIA